MQNKFSLFKLSTFTFVLISVLVWFSCQVSAHHESALTHYEQLMVKKATSFEESLNSQTRIEYISSIFLNTPYQANRLIGSPQIDETLVIDFRALDCFTYIDYVESLRRASSRQEFELLLPEVRYQNGDINFLSRNHFFVDWKNNNRDIIDATSIVTDSSVSVDKALNLKSDGHKFIDSLPAREARIRYIPQSNVNQSVLDQLKTGDYIGIYTPIEGLDVTHVGIFIRNNEGVFLRHASSKSNVLKVVDSPFMAYIKNTPGIIVYRIDKPLSN